MILNNHFDAVMPDCGYDNPNKLDRSITMKITNAIDREFLQRKYFSCVWPFYEWAVSDLDP